MRLHPSFLILCLLTVLACSKQEIQADIHIKNGTVYNGLDSTSQQQSIAIKGEKIIFVGDEASVNIIATETIDATGHIVCPGFIDPHTHADQDLKKPKTSHNLPYLMQGVTTVVVGNDGRSLFPVDTFRAVYEKHGIGTNVVMMTGHGTLRNLVVGRSNRKASEEEMLNMQKALQREMENGSFGLTTGLFYAPGSYSDTEEVIALAKVSAKYGGIYESHLRDEGSYSVGLKAAIEEAIEIGRKADIPVNIAHIKCLGADVWQQSSELVKLIEKSRAEGLDVTANQYPYDASSTGLLPATVPRWAESGGKDSLFIRYNQKDLRQKILEETLANITRRGGPDKLLLVKVQDSTLLNKTLLEISEALNLPAEQTVYEIMRNNDPKVASFNMTTEDIHEFMRQEWTVTCSDGTIGHPRKYGSFPRKYRKYVKEDKVISVARFINNSSAKTASIFKIPNRGVLQEGYFADVIIFDPETFEDKADYTNAFEQSEGLAYSIINGDFVVKKGLFNGKLNGRVLKK